MKIQSPYKTFQRFRTLQTHRISSLPIVILMPHSSCNCRCVMCDIWKGNKNQKQLTEKDIGSLLTSLENYGTSQVLMSGGEALLNPNFFRFCEILKKSGIRITLLSTGLTIKKYALQITEWVDDVIISVDGPEAIHDIVRNIPGAFAKMKEGIEAVRLIDPSFKISGRSVIQHINFKYWPNIIKAARDLGLNSISFLPADISSPAFNRPEEWPADKQAQVLLQESELQALDALIEKLIGENEEDFKNHFIAESPEKLRKIGQYYAAHYGLTEFPYKKCNAPWVSTVIEADGTVRPCFFHESFGNIKTKSFDDIINGESAVSFRKNLDMDTNPTCVKCVCSLNLKPSFRI